MKHKSIPTIRREHAAVAKALRDYHHALDTRQHGGVAASQLADEIEDALKNPWIRGATLKPGT